MNTATAELLPEGSDRRMEYEMLSVMFPEYVGPVEQVGEAFSYYVTVRNPSADDATDEDGTYASPDWPPAELCLRVVLPDGYPEEGALPGVRLEDGSLPKTASHRRQCHELEAELRRVAEENQGTAVVTTLYQHVQDWLEAVVERELRAKREAAEAATMRSKKNSAAQVKLEPKVQHAEVTSSGRLIHSTSPDATATGSGSDGTLDKADQVSKLIMLAGLPGSGKSSFARTLVELSSSLSERQQQHDFSAPMGA